MSNRSSLMALFKLAWSAKLQIPVLITVVFMACDIRLQLEINIFWETNNTRPHAMPRNTTGGQARRSSREDMRRAALVASALYQQQRRRLIQDMRAQQARQREAARSQSLPVNAPLATEEDSDLEGSHEGNLSDSTLSCSHDSVTSEAGSFGSDEDETEDGDETKEKQGTGMKRKRKVKRSRPSSKEPNNEEEDEEEDEETTTDDDEDEDEDDEENGGGMNGGSSSHGGGGYRDDTYEDDDDSDDMDDSSQTEGGGGYNSPLVLEIELRHRPLHPSNGDGRQMPHAKQTVLRSTKPFQDFKIYSLFQKERNNFNSMYSNEQRLLL